MVIATPRTTAEIGVQSLLRELQVGLGISDRELAQILEVELSTIQNWRAGTIPQRGARERLAQLRALLEELRDSFRTQDGAAAWMHSASLYLGGITPLQALRVQQFDRVDAALEVLNSGMFL